MFPTITIGPAAFPTGGLVYIFGVYACLSLIEWSAKRRQQNYTVLYTLGVVSLGLGLFAARLTFVVTYWSAFQENLLGIVWPLTSGYNSTVGWIVAIIAAFFYGRYQQLPLLPSLDTLIAPVVALLMVISLADFMAGPGYGSISTAPWAIAQFGIRRHPVQLYELIVGGIALLVWWRLSRRSFTAGVLLWSTTAVYAAGRLFVDGFRENAWVLPNGLHIIQILCLFLLLFALIQLRSTIHSSNSPISPAS